MHAKTLFLGRPASSYGRQIPKGILKNEATHVCTPGFSVSLDQSLRSLKNPGPVVRAETAQLGRVADCHECAAMSHAVSRKNASRSSRNSESKMFRELKYYWSSRLLSRFEKLLQQRYPLFDNCL